MDSAGDDDRPPEEDGEAPTPPVPQVPPVVLLAHDSPLRALPLHLDRAQMLVLDGISASIDMTMVAYRQLQNALLENDRSTDPTSRRAATVVAVMNAWTIVDAVHRLGVLLPRLRHLRRGPAVRAFLKTTEQVEPLRHTVQHLNGEIPRLLNDGRSIWGALSWVHLESPDADQFHVGLLMPGTMGPTYELPMVNPLGREVEIPIGLVTLTAAEGQDVCLSEVVSAVGRFAGRLERAAAAAFSALPDTLGAQARFDLPID